MLHNISIATMSWATGIFQPFWDHCCIGYPSLTEIYTAGDRTGIEINSANSFVYAKPNPIVTTCPTLSSAGQILYELHTHQLKSTPGSIHQGCMSINTFAETFQKTYTPMNARNILTLCNPITVFSMSSPHISQMFLSLSFQIKMYAKSLCKSGL